MKIQTTVKDFPRRVKKMRIAPETQIQVIIMETQPITESPRDNFEQIKTLEGIGQSQLKSKEALQALFEIKPSKSKSGKSIVETIRELRDNN